MMESSAQRLASEFQQMHTVLTAGASPAEARRRLVELACRAVPGCDWAAITSWPSTRPAHTVASSGEIAQVVDDIQYQCGEGPCLSAVAQESTEWSTDLTSESRWPSFARRAVAETPVRGVLSLPLPGLPVPSALKMYAGQARAFDQESLATGALFAGHAGILMAHIGAAQQVENLQAALTTSRQIGAAVGLLMSSYDLSQETAFEVLTRTSRQLHRKLRDIADEVVKTGKLPD